MSSDLSLVTNDEMWEELKRRHDGVVLIMHRDINKHQTDTLYWFSGGKHLCLGLVRSVEHALRHDLLTPQEEEDHDHTD